MYKLRALVFVSCLLFSSSAIYAQQTPTTLQPGTPIERTVETAEVHTFVVKLEENNLLEFVVEQKGIDLVVRVMSPNGKRLGEYDSPNGDNGPEHVSLVASTPGSYQILVGPLSPTQGSSGRYVIKILELRKATEQEIKAGKNLEIAKARGIALLADIEAAIAQIKSPQTRIRSQIQAAQLLWDADEKRALKCITDAMNGMKEYLAALDMNSVEYFEQYAMVSQIRTDIIHVLAPRDPDAALSFLYSSVIQLPYDSRYDQFIQESALELSIAEEIMAKDPKRALQIARKILKKGYSGALLNTLSILKSKNPELASEFANELVSKLLGEKLLKSTEAANVATGLLRFRPLGNVGNPDGRQGLALNVLLSEDQYRELTRKLFDEALAFSLPSPQSYSPERDTSWTLLNSLQSMGPELDSVVPGAHAALHKKMLEFTGAAVVAENEANEYDKQIADRPVDEALQALDKAPAQIREQLFVQLASREATKGETARAREILNERVVNPYQKRQALADIDQQEMYKALNAGKVEDAVRILSAFRDPRARVSQVAQVANRVGAGQKRATAVSLLEQLRGMLPPAPQAQDQEQMTALLEIGRAFSRYDVRRAFEIIDPLIDQFNEMCAAARTLDGFGASYYVDDEMNLQNGNNIAAIASQISNVLGSIALTNFDRAKAASDRIRLPEIRLKTYLDIAQITQAGK